MTSVRLSSYSRYHVSLSLLRWDGVTALNLTDSLKVKGVEWPGVGLMVEGSFR